MKQTVIITVRIWALDLFNQMPFKLMCRCITNRKDISHDLDN